MPAPQYIGEARPALSGLRQGLGEVAGVISNRRDEYRQRLNQEAQNHWSGDVNVYLAERARRNITDLERDLRRAGYGRRERDALIARAKDTPLEEYLERYGMGGGQGQVAPSVDGISATRRRQVPTPTEGIDWYASGEGEGEGRQRQPRPKPQIAGLTTELPEDWQTVDTGEGKSRRQEGYVSGDDLLARIYAEVVRDVERGVNLTDSTAHEVARRFANQTGREMNINDVQAKLDKIDREGDPNLVVGRDAPDAPAEPERLPFSTEQDFARFTADVVEDAPALRELYQRGIQLKKEGTIKNAEAYAANAYMEGEYGDTLGLSGSDYMGWRDKKWEGPQRNAGVARDWLINNMQSLIGGREDQGRAPEEAPPPEETEVVDDKVVAKLRTATERFNANLLRAEENENPRFIERGASEIGDALAEQERRRTPEERRAHKQSAAQGFLRLIENQDGRAMMLMGAMNGDQDLIAAGERLAAGGNLAENELAFRTAVAKMEEAQAKARTATTEADASPLMTEAELAKLWADIGFTNARTQEVGMKIFDYFIDQRTETARIALDAMRQGFEQAEETTTDKAELRQIQAQIVANTLDLAEEMKGLKTEQVDGILRLVDSVSRSYDVEQRGLFGRRYGVTTEGQSGDAEQALRYFQQKYSQGQ